MEQNQDEIKELTLEEIEQMTVEQMKQKIEQNNKQIRKANIFGPIMSTGFAVGGVLSAIFAPGIGQWGFPVIAGAALASSVGYQVEVNVKLKNENKKLERQIEIENLKQKIALKEQKFEIEKPKTSQNQAVLENQPQTETTSTYQLDDGLSI